MTHDEFMACWNGLGQPKQVRLAVRGEVIQGKLKMPGTIEGILVVSTGFTSNSDFYVALSSVDAVAHAKGIL